MRKINIFIQARMSSTRYPGKMLAPLKGNAVIKTMLEQLSSFSKRLDTIILTSVEASDDPLCAYLDSLKVVYFRGNLENVLARFQSALSIYPCDYFVRLCGDSPFISPSLIEYAVSLIEQFPDADLITNIYPRTFPKGQSIEIIKSQSFSQLKQTLLTQCQQEHITKFYYDNAKNFKIGAFRQMKDDSHVNLCIDTAADFERLEKWNDDYPVYPEQLMAEYLS